MIVYTCNGEKQLQQREQCYFLPRDHFLTNKMTDVVRTYKLCTLLIYLQEKPS